MEEANVISFKIQGNKTNNVQNEKLANVKSEVFKKIAKVKR